MIDIERNSKILLFIILFEKLLTFLKNKIYYIFSIHIHYFFLFKYSAICIIKILIFKKGKESSGL